MKLAIVVALAFGVVSCTSWHDRHTGELAEFLLPHLKCPNAHPANGILSFSHGSVEEGYGVVVESFDSMDNHLDPLVYWVFDAQIYTVNQAAKDCSPNLPPAPEAVTVGKILVVAK